jgi:lipopolysaccharide export system protein LptC
VAVPLPSLSPAHAPAHPVHGATPWPLRVRNTLSSYLPLLLMLLLALATWWLIKNTPHAEDERGPVIPKHVPDYSMRHFAVQRFAADGRPKVRIEGEQMRHYPDTDTIEIDTVRIRSVGADGRTVEATARLARANADATDVQLLGGAHVVSRAASAAEPPIEFDGETLDARLDTERLHSDQPVTVRQGATEVRAQGFDYDNLSRRVRLAGRVQAQVAPAPRRH